MSDIPEVIDEVMGGYAPAATETYAPKPGYKINFDPPKQKFSAIWLISFTDLMGITLTFFVLLFTMSGMSKKDAPVGQERNVTQEASKYAGASENAGPEDAISINKVDFNESLNLGYLKSVLDEMAASTPILQKVRMIEDAPNQRLIITLPHDLLFEKGQADLTADGRKAVQAITAVLKNIPNGIEIVGHADPVQASAKGTPNWDLSLSRALAVAGVMASQGYTRGLPVKGYSSGLYDSLPDDMPQERREALSRRVDILINSHDGTAQQRFGIGP